MAEIVYGFGASHSPLLSTPPEKWDLRAKADRQNPAHPFRGKVYTFDELLALRGPEGLAAEHTSPVRAERHARCQTQLDHLADRLAEIGPDVVLIIGDDQREWFLDDIQPAFCVYYGDTVLNAAFDEEEARQRPPGVIYSMRAARPPLDRLYPCASDLALRIIEQAMADGFDVATSREPPGGPEAPRGIGHAFGFICRRILRDEPRPLLPVLINTYYPPNQPTVGRCYAFGRSIGRAIRAWPSKARVAIAASGGLSHFVVDEEHDRRMIDALLAGDVDALTAEPDHMFQSGTSETKNWIISAGILAEAGLEMRLLDYVPCYRSDAGTGCAMAFATWE